MAINKQNLVVPTSEQARKNGSKGGIASVKAKKKKKDEEKVTKTFKDLFIELSDMPVTKKTDPTGGKLTKLVKTLFPRLKSKELTQRVLMYASLYKKALKGGHGAVQAFNTIRDTMGEKPVDKVENTNTQLVAITSDENRIRAIIEKAKNA